MLLLYLTTCPNDSVRAMRTGIVFLVTHRAASLWHNKHVLTVVESMNHNIIASQEAGRLAELQSLWRH